MPLDVLHDHDRVVDDETDRQHDGEKGQQIDREAGHEHQEDRPNERNGDGDHGNDQRAHRTEEEEDDDNDDEEGLREGLENLIDGVPDVDRRIVGDSGFHPHRELRLNLRHRFARPTDHVERVGGGKHPDSHEDGGLPVETDVLLVVLGAQRDVGDLAQPHDDALLFLDDELSEFLGGLEVRVGDEVDGHHGPFGLSQRGEIVVLCQRVPHVRGRDATSGHLGWIEPDAHGEVASAQDLGALHAADGAQLRLHDAREVIADLVLIEVFGGEAEVHRGELGVRGFELDDRCLGLRREVVAHLGDLRLDLGEGGVRVVVELQVHGDRAAPLGARRLEVVDAVRPGDHPLERRGDETADEIGAGADVGGRHLDDRDVAARILPHGEGPDGLQARDQDDQIDDDRQDRPTDEEIRELHHPSSGRGAGSFAG